MSRYDGLIIPRSYSEYINKTDAATLLQALQLSGVMDNLPTANSNHPVKSSGIKSAIDSLAINSIVAGETRPPTSGAVENTIKNYNKTATSVFDTAMLSRMDTEFNNTAEYSRYTFGSSAGKEFAVYGFKHNNTKGGVCLVMTVNYGVILGAGRGLPSTWNYKYVITP